MRETASLLERLGFAAFPTVCYVINRARAASLSSLARRQSVEFNEASGSMKRWNEIRLVSVRHGWNIEYEPPSAKLLSIAPDAAGQWMVMDDKDNGYLMKVPMMPFMFLWLRWTWSAFLYLRVGHHMVHKSWVVLIPVALHDHIFSVTFTPFVWTFNNKKSFLIL